MIDADLVRTMFERMRKEGVNTEAPLLWGYFFFDTDRDRLHNAGRLLERRGYAVVSVHRDDPDEDGGPETHTLHVERVEVHSVESLLVRNAELDALARECGLMSYDGMDVGELPDDSSGEDAPN